MCSFVNVGFISHARRLIVQAWFWQRMLLVLSAILPLWKNNPQQETRKVCFSTCFHVIYNFFGEIQIRFLSMLHYFFETATIWYACIWCAHMQSVWWYFMISFVLSPQYLVNTDKIQIYDDGSACIPKCTTHMDIVLLIMILPKRNYLLSKAESPPTF